MINKLEFEGHVEKINFKNEQVAKFTVCNTCKGREKRITATVFNGYDTKKIYEQMESFIGKLVLVGAEMYETKYVDKNTGDWVNTYCVYVKELMER